MSALKQLSASLPVANSQVASQQQAARDMQLQTAVQKASPTTNTAAAAQQTGAAVAQQAGDQQVEATKAGMTQQTQVGQLGQQATAAANAAEVAGLQSGSREAQIDNVQKLAAVSEEAKQEMYDSRRQFAEDELGRKFTNDRQLSDYARLRSKTDQDWADYQQRTEQLYQRKNQMLNTAYTKLATQLEYENRAINQLQDQLGKKDLTQDQQDAQRAILQKRLTQKQELERASAELQKSMARDKAKAANRQAMFQAGGTIVGAAVGTAFGGPVGGAIGASAGGAVGSMAAGIGG